MPRRSAEQQIAALEAQIAALKAKAAAEKVEKDPALKFVSKAIRFIDTASGETKDAAMRESLQEARSTLSACLQLKGVAPIAQASRSRRRSRGGGVDRDTLLAYVRNNPGSHAEQFAAALGMDVKTMWPMMKGSIAQQKIQAPGETRRWHDSLV